MRNSLTLIKGDFPHTQQQAGLLNCSIQTGPIHKRAGTHNSVNNMIGSFTNEVNHSIRLSIKNSFVLLHETVVSMGTEPLACGLRQNTRRVGYLCVPEEICAVNCYNKFTKYYITYQKQQQKNPSAFKLTL